MQIEDIPQAAWVATWAAQPPRWIMGASGPSAKLALTEQQVPTHLHTSNGSIPLAALYLMSSHPVQAFLVTYYHPGFLCPKQGTAGSVARNTRNAAVRTWQ